MMFEVVGGNGQGATVRTELYSYKAKFLPMGHLFLFTFFPSQFQITKNFKTFVSDILGVARHGVTPLYRIGKK